MRAYSTLDVSLEGDVLEIRLDRPEKRNAVTGEMHGELAHVFRDAAESDARVVVLTGAGKAFSAGGDFERMDEVTDDHGELAESFEESKTILHDIVNLDKPLVARVNGDAIGLGCTLALCCDVVVVEEGARLGDPHVNVGLPAGDGGVMIWPLLVGLNTAKKFLLTGDLLTGAEAADIGLVTDAVASDELDECVEEYVSTFATGSQPAIRYTKAALNGWLRLGLHTGLYESMAIEKFAQVGEDHRAAVNALLDGRQPVFPSARDPDEE